MFHEKLKEQMARRNMTARELHAALIERGIKVSLWTFRKWMQGTRRPKPYVQDAILHILTF